MEQLFKSTAAYKILCGDRAANRLSHAYMLYFADSSNLRAALKMLAAEFFGAEKGSRDERLIEEENLADMRIYPTANGKLNAEAAAEIVSGSAVKPLEKDKKLYVICGLEGASPIVQNKLLKVLEEPPENVHFLLGTTSLAPVLATVKSRVKLLEVPPFTEDDIYSALCRDGDNPLNREAARACGGVLGIAREMLSGGWYKEVRAAATELCSASTVAKAAATALKYADFKLKTELLTEMQRIYFSELKSYAADENYKGALKKGAVVYAANAIGGALRDVRFNANFSSLLYDLTLRVASENERW